MSVLILLSTYNGEKYLREQLDSLLNQTVSVEILVRDDGSTDSTCEILDEYKIKGKLDWYTGDNVKSAKSFWDLVKKAPQADFYAFCDQDDYWFENKIERALSKISQIENQNQPILYCSNVTVADSTLRPIKDMSSSGNTFTDFPHSLIYSLAPGCTFVFNARAMEEFIKYDMNTNFEIIHDWLAHKIVAMMGLVIYDSQPSMLYRQHGNNVIGAQRKGLKSFFSRVHRMLTSHANVRSRSAKSLLDIYGNEISIQSRNYLSMVAYYQTDKKLKKQFLKSKDFKVLRKGDIFLKILIKLNKV